MILKVGRNDPCPCGSGKKYKQCCLAKSQEKQPPRKLKAVWVNQPVHSDEPVNLIERNYGRAISSVSDKFANPSQHHQSENQASDS